MRIAISFLIGLVLSLNVHAQENTIPPMAATPNWFLIGAGTVAKYEALIPSIMVDKETRSMQFDMKTTFHKPSKLPNGKEVYVVIEHVLLLCGNNLFVSTAQVQYSKEKEIVFISKDSDVYMNRRIAGDPISQIMQWGCGIKVRNPDESKGQKNVEA